jgi:hypothetical protein
MSGGRAILRELRAVGAIRGREHLRDTPGSKRGENLAFSEDARDEHLREHLCERLREGLGSKPRENLAPCEDAYLGNDERLPRNPQEFLLSFNHRGLFATKMLMKPLTWHLRGNTRISAASTPLNRRRCSRLSV